MQRVHGKQTEVCPSWTWVAGTVWPTGALRVLAERFGLDVGTGTAAHGG